MLLQREKRRKVSHSRAATFNGKSGDPDLQLRATYGWSLANLVALLRQQLFVYRNLMTWLNQPFAPPPELTEQLLLPLA
jgi:hypothetical protein